MSWEAMCEQLAFDTELSDVLIEGQDCLVMSSRWLNEFHYDAELDLEGMATNRAINRLISMKQERFERRFRRLGSKVNRLSDWNWMTKGDIQDADNMLHDDIDEGRALGSWCRPGFYGEFKWEEWD